VRCGARLGAIQTSGGTAGRSVPSGAL